MSKKKSKSMPVQDKQKKDYKSFTVTNSLDIKMPNRTTQVHKSKKSYKRKPKHVKSLLDKYL